MMNKRLQATAMLLAVVFILTSQTIGLSKSNRQSEVTPQEPSLVDERDYVGNVAGVVVDVETGAPIEGAEIVLVDKPLRRSEKETAFTVQSNKGFIVVPADAVVSPLRTVTDSNGEFLINSVPTPNPSKDYTVLASVSGYDGQCWTRFQCYQVQVCPWR